jgi:hypothetical protein
LTCHGRNNSSLVQYYVVIRDTREPVPRSYRMIHIYLQRCYLISYLRTHWRSFRTSFRALRLLIEALGWRNHSGTRNADARSLIRNFLSRSSSSFLTRRWRQPLPPSYGPAVCLLVGLSNVETHLRVFNEQQVPGEELDMVHLMSKISLNRPPTRILTRERRSYLIYLSIDKAVPGEWYGFTLVESKH